MSCPQCGHKIGIEDAKYCPNCGYDLSKIGKGEPTELKKMIDFALKDHQTKKVSADQTQNPEIETKPQSLTETKQALPETAEEITLPNGKKNVWKWGWGWYILFGIVFTFMKRRYGEYGDYQLLLQLFAIVISLSVYYVCRRKIFKSVQVLWQRSFYSGLIAFVVAIFVTAFTALLLPTQGDRLAGKFQEEAQILISHTQGFMQKDQRLWSQFIFHNQQQKRITRTTS
jgi:hypothetical protein